MELSLRLDQPNRGADRRNISTATQQVIGTDQHPANAPAISPISNSFRPMTTPGSRRARWSTSPAGCGTRYTSGGSTPPRPRVRSATTVWVVFPAGEPMWLGRGSHAPRSAGLSVARNLRQPAITRVEGAAATAPATVSRPCARITPRGRYCCCSVASSSCAPRQLPTSTDATARRRRAPHLVGRGPSRARRGPLPQCAASAFASRSQGSQAVNLPRGSSGARPIPDRDRPRPRTRPSQPGCVPGASAEPVPHADAPSPPHPIPSAESGTVLLRLPVVPWRWPMHWNSDGSGNGVEHALVDVDRLGRRVHLLGKDIAGRDVCVPLQAGRSARRVSAAAPPTFPLPRLAQKLEQAVMMDRSSGPSPAPPCTHEQL